MEEECCFCLIEGQKQDEGDVDIVRFSLFVEREIGGGETKSGWPRGLRRCVQVAVHFCGRGFESHF